MGLCQKSIYMHLIVIFLGVGGGAGLVLTSFGNFYSLECILDSAILITGKNGKFL